MPTGPISGVMLGIGSGMADVGCGLGPATGEPVLVGETVVPSVGSPMASLVVRMVGVAVSTPSAGVADGKGISVLVDVAVGTSVAVCACVGDGIRVKVGVGGISVGVGSISQVAIKFVV